VGLVAILALAAAVLAVFVHRLHLLVAAVQQNPLLLQR
jgi:hypothetical protein